jgi:ArsR family transcriptional regulator
MPPLNHFKRRSKVLQALAQPMRLQLLEILSLRPACVCDLVRLTGKRQPYISQHLSVLSAARLVVSERDGRRIFYRLNPDTVDDVLQALHQLCQLKTNIKERNNSHV